MSSWATKFAPNPSAARSAGEVGPQSGFVDLPIAVLGAVEQHDREPIAVFGAKGGVAGRRGRVDIGDGKCETEFARKLGKLRGRGRAQRTALACQQLHLSVHPASIPVK